MRIVTYLASAKLITGQFVPNGMPMPAHLVASLATESKEIPEHSSHYDAHFYDEKSYDEKNYGENTYDDLLSFEQPELSYDDFVFDEEAMPIVIGFLTVNFFFRPYFDIFKNTLFMSVFALD